MARNHLDSARTRGGKALSGRSQPNYEQEEMVALLSDPASYPHAPEAVEIVETHMALVFIAGNLVFKMKRAIKLRFVDARLLQTRKELCQRELELNQVLAPKVYLRLAAVTREADGNLALGGTGEPVEWLVVMRRLEEARSLMSRIACKDVTPADIERLIEVLADFYSRQQPAPVSGNRLLQLWQKGVALIRQTLTDPQFDLETELVVPPLDLLDHFLSAESGDIIQRVEDGRIIDGHGDLKPDHVYLGNPVLLIDRLEFADHLRWCDPFDEVISLGMECQRLGASWIGPQLIGGLGAKLGHRPPDNLLAFYHCYRACLRARLSIEHLLDETPRTPERWPRQTREYLQVAMQFAQS